eukprot:6172500-Pleurochrysis_carterae.AAC.3
MGLAGLLCKTISSNFELPGLLGVARDARRCPTRCATPPRRLACAVAVTSAIASLAHYIERDRQPSHI